MQPISSYALSLSLILLFFAPSLSAQRAKREVPEIAGGAIKSAVLLIISDEAGNEIKQGSGFVVSKDGKIVTNYHVIEEADSALVKFSNGAFYLIEGVLGVDRQRDIAVLKATAKDLPFLPLGNSSDVQVGEHVVAVGSPLAIEASVSDGIISAIREMRFDQTMLTVLQTTAPISPGSSGGALLNMKGEVIGVTAAQISGGQNLNLAIPIKYVVPLLSYSSAKPLEQYKTQDKSTIASVPALPDKETPSAAVGKHPNAPWLDGERGPVPVRWEMKERDGKLYGTANRMDKACLALAKEQVENPSATWNGCIMPASITKDTLTVPNLLFTYMLYISVVPHYTDSERIDMAVTVEQPDHTYRTYLRKDVPIVIQGRVLTASIDIAIPYEPLSVPTINAKEKGGKREATHSYR